MQTRKLFLVGSCLAGLALVVASCAPVTAPATKAEVTAAPSKEGTAAVRPTAVPSPSTKAVGEQPRYGGVLTRANYEDAPHLDIHQASGMNALLSLANVYNGLVRFDTTDLDKVIPDLAESWDVSSDGKVYTFHLRKGVSWHDGGPFTSDGAKFSLERMAFSKEHNIVSPRGGQALSAVAKVEALEPTTLQVTLKYPNASFIGNAACGWVLMLPKHVIQAKGDMKKDAIGTGPFKWKAWNFGVSQELVKNANYFLKDLPYLYGITVYPIKDDATRFAAFRTGQVKMTGIASKALTDVQAEFLRKVMADKAVVISHAALVRFLFIMHSKKKPWDDIRVRQAVDLAFDRQAAIKVNFGVGLLGAALHPKGAWGIPEEEITKQPGYRQPKEADIAQAKKLLAEAGYPQGFKTTLLIVSGGASEQQGVVAKDQLAKINIDLTLDIKESTAVYDRLDRHDFGFILYSFGESLDDPDAILSAYYITDGSRNFGEFSDKQIDDLFSKQAAILDQKERKEVVLQIQRRILDLAIYPVTFWGTYNLAFWKEVRGYMPSIGAYSHDNLDHVWLAK